LQHAAPRPLYSVLGSERGLLLPTLEDALSRYLRDCEMQAIQQPEDTKAMTARSARS
jgi:hypothetical protein